MTGSSEGYRSRGLFHCEEVWSRTQADSYGARILQDTETYHSRVKRQEAPCQHAHENRWLRLRGKNNPLIPDSPHMDHILALKRLTPAKSSSEYAFGGQVSLKEDVVVSVASAWRHLRAFAVSLSRDAIDETLILLQNVPEIAIAWLDLGCAELQKDVFAPVWNEAWDLCLRRRLHSHMIVICKRSCSNAGHWRGAGRIPRNGEDARVSRRVGLRSAPHLRCGNRIPAVWKPWYGCVFVVAALITGCARADVIAECLRLFASLLLSCGGDGEDDIAAAHVIASPDIVQKAVFVARNAVDAPIVQSALGFLINLSIAVPNLFTKNLAECRAAKVAADEQSASAAALAAALGVAPGNNTAAVTSNDPESLFAISFGCAAAIPVTEGDSPRIQLLGRWLDTLLRLLDPALAVTLLLSKCDTLNSVLLQSNAPASTDSSAKRLIDSICQVSSRRG